MPQINIQGFLGFLESCPQIVKDPQIANFQNFLSILVVVVVKLCSCCCCNCRLYNLMPLEKTLVTFCKEYIAQVVQ